MGRTAQPAALKLIGGRGNGRDSGGRVVNPGPAFRRLPPKPPTWLSREAAAEWKRVVPGLQRLDLLHGALVDAGWSRREATMIAAGLMYIVFGSALSSFSSGFSADPADYSGRYPHLDRAHLLPGVAHELDRDSFELALAAFVRGL